MKFALIPAGEFMMGSTEAEVGNLAKEAAAANKPQWIIERVSSEAPKHRVRITKPFYLAMYEVTQAEYVRVMGVNPSKFTGNPTCPVDNVTWDEASEFCRKLAELPEERAAGAEYRLPTEAEWEYACRAGTSSTWHSGDDESALHEYAWFAADSGGTTHPVGQKLPNAWGLFDMHGNVFEWCQDLWSDDGYYARSPVDDPTGTSGGSDRVNRGGDYSGGSEFLRAAGRLSDRPSFRAARLGFRVVRSR
jgi:formylglycine-generating enzyme required for sulfatase activity